MEINFDSLVFNQSYIQFDALYLNGKYYKKNVLSARLFTLCLSQYFVKLSLREWKS